MGLLISDSFRTVVTIYILIPFLVIPQIMLSGIIVKFENLNPQISSPKRIPIYGEVITARWAYEALTTYQFMNNEHQKHFYEWNKLKSNANLKANYYIKELQNKLAFIERNLDKPEEQEKIRYNLDLLRTEIRDEYRDRLIMHSYYKETPTYSMKYVDQLQPGSLSTEILDYTREYLQALKDFYVSTFKTAVTRENEIIASFDLEELRELERNYANNTLEEFVTNDKSFTYYTEYNGDLIQKKDLIYQDPSYRFVKAHFYAPRKMVGRSFVPTIWVNVMVIWVMTLCLYVLLYFRVLKKFLDWMERLSARKAY
jgi:hypothetical protein